MDLDNYELDFLSTLKSNSRLWPLTRFLEDSHTPPRFLTVEDSASNKVSLVFTLHQQQDHILVAWLLGSMTMPILTKMVGLCTTF